MYAKASIIAAALLVVGTTAQISTANTNTTSWKQVNIPMNTCTADSGCSYLTNSTYGYTNVCCATWKSQPVAGGSVTTLGNACVDQDTDFYTANFTSSGNNIWFNCSINSNWSTYQPATWTAIGSTSCTSNAQCTASGTCCNNNNATYSGSTNTYWEPDNFCMSQSLDQINYNWYSTSIAGINFTVNSQCLSTSYTVRGAVMPSTPATSTGATTTTGAHSLFATLISVVLIAVSTLF